MIKLLLEGVEYAFYKMGRQVVIADRAEDGQQLDRPYLIRTIIAQNKYFCIYLHRFLCSDLETYHDHPWSFWTYVISGNYTEHSLRTFTEGVMGTRIVPVNNHDREFLDMPFMVKRTKGSLAYRHWYDIHRVVVDKERTLDELSDAPFTLCVMGKRIREWGFWKHLPHIPKIDHTRPGQYMPIHTRRFVPWREFLKLTDKQKDHYEKRA